MEIGWRNLSSSLLILTATILIFDPRNSAARSANHVPWLIWLHIPFGARTHWKKQLWPSDAICFEPAELWSVLRFQNSTSQHSQLAISSHIEPHIAALGMFNVLNLSESIMLCSSSVGFQPKGTNPRRLAESTVPNSTTTLQQEQTRTPNTIHKIS